MLSEYSLLSKARPKLWREGEEQGPVLRLQSILIHMVPPDEPREEIRDLEDRVLIGVYLSELLNLHGPAPFALSPQEFFAVLPRAM